MSKSFRLAGLLRFRQAQEEQAAAALARANARRKEHEVRVGRVRGILADTPSDPASATALRASAAARSSARSMLLELHALTDSTSQAAVEAQAELLAAKKSAASLENLELKHRAGQQQLMLRDEQLFLDELASSRSMEASTPGLGAMDRFRQVDA